MTDHSGKKNILYILNSSSGGATQGIIELLYKVDRNKYTPYIIPPNQPNSVQLKNFRLTCESYAVIRMDWWNKKYNTPLIKRVITSLSSILKSGLNLITVYKIIRKVREWNIDIIHTSTSLTIQGSIASKLTNKPDIWHVRERIGSDGLFKFWFPDKILRFIFKHLSDWIIPESHYAGTIFLNKNRMERVKVIHDGVDTDEYTNLNLGKNIRRNLNINSSNLLIGMVANLSATMKRHDIFIKVAAILAKKHSNVYFAIFGAEPKAKNNLYNEGYIYASKIKQLVIDLDIKKQFIWGGFQPNIPELMSAIDVLVHPCEVEGFGRIAIESMAAGKPVIGPTAGGIAETVKNNTTGILVQPGNIHSFAEAVENLIINDKLRMQLGTQAKQHVANSFSISTHTNKITEIYDSI